MTIFWWLVRLEVVEMTTTDEASANNFLKLHFRSNVSTTKQTTTQPCGIRTLNLYTCKCRGSPRGLRGQFIMMMDNAGPITRDGGISARLWGPSSRMSFPVTFESPEVDCSKCHEEKTEDLFYVSWIQDMLTSFFCQRSAKNIQSYHSEYTLYIKAFYYFNLAPRGSFFKADKLVSSHWRWRDGNVYQKVFVLTFGWRVEVSST